MIVALLASTGAAWESAALGVLNRHPGVVVLKRCVDVDDLVATASAGQADVAVVGADLPGLDAAVVDQLRRYGVRVVGVATDADAARACAERIGVTRVVDADAVAALPEALAEPVPVGGEPTLAGPTRPGAADADAARTALGRVPPPAAAATPGPGPGRVVAVWGAAGAPGRTTVAVSVAAELARRRLVTVLVDADPYGGAVAQQLGILDEVSGLLAAARLATAGTLAERWPTVPRRLTDHLTVVTGLPRPDRWAEVRPGTLAQLVERAREGAQVVVDTGFSLERDPVPDLGARPERNGMTIEALDAADEVLVVGSADPVGLARLARAVAEAHETLTAPRLRLVVNRMRPTLGWREADVVAMLGGFGPVVGVHFLPDDQPALDRALVAGRTPLECGDSPFTRGVATLLDAMAGVRRS